LCPQYLRSYFPPRLPRLPTFPTRRSSDLSNSPVAATSRTGSASGPWAVCPLLRQNRRLPARLRVTMEASPAISSNGQNSSAAARSEEHTSELQSRENLVCRLLLEKKNNAT